MKKYISIDASGVILIALLVIKHIGISSGFAAIGRIPVSTSHRSTIIPLKSQNNDDDDAMRHNKQRTCVNQFLTQRSLQNFMFLCEQVRDPHTGNWIEKLLGKTDMLNFHGTGALDVERFPSWDSFFKELIQQPKTSIIVQAKRRGRGHGGWSKNNPYMKDRYVEFEIKIDPESLLPRIMSVREQLAREFTEDVDMVRTANDQILDSYEGTTYADGKSIRAFDRNAYMILINNLTMAKSASSPFRKGSYDLLQLLSLQEAIHRVLRQYMSKGRDKEAAFQFLREFYVSRTASHFDGYVNYGRADDFIEELLLTTPSVRESGKYMELVDPHSTATDIIDARSEVLREWKDIMVDVPNAHIELRKVLLTKQMGRATEQAASQPISVEEEMGAWE